MNLKQKLSKKLKKSGGFTLIEMLIVVAIIAILVAVSIPLVSSSLEKARTATDQANERAAKSAAMIQYLTDGESDTKYYFYNAENGTVKEVESSATSSKPGDIDAYGQCSDHKGGVVLVEITADTTTKDLTSVEVTWVGGTNDEAHGVTATTKPST